VLNKSEDMQKKYVIVGGVAGGATTAARLRRIDEKAEIIMLEKGEHISYANCGLPYYIGGVITDRDKLLVQTPESFGGRFNIDVRIFSEVVDIDSDKQMITVRNLQSGEEYTENYDKLVLSPGARPVKPPIPGIEHKNIFTLRNVSDTDEIKEFVDDEKPHSAIVVGAGFIGLEVAENLHHKKIKVTVVEAAPQVMNMMDPEMAATLHQHFKEQNVGLFLQDAVKEFRDNGDEISVLLASGNILKADFVILSIGVKPDVGLAQKSGLQLGTCGGIVVDDYLQTSKENIYAVGDAIEFPHPITGQPALAFLAGPANKQGRILADNMVYGHKRKYLGSIGTAIAKVFDMTAGVTGLSDKALAQAGIPHQSTIVNAGSHAGYYPGATNMILKITFNPESGQLLGGQVIGYDGVDKRIDLIASIIKRNGDIYDLQEVEHAYAPPYSSAKDPVSQAGYNAENIIKGLFLPLSPYKFHDWNQSDSCLIDVRTPDEYSLNSLGGSVNIELDKLRDHLDKIPRDKNLYIFCGVGLRGYVAARILKQNGFEKVYNLSGGLKVYQTAIAKQDNPIKFNTSEEAVPVGTNDSMERMPYISAELLQVDACGLQCPGPILKLKEEIEKIGPGGEMQVKATDPGFYNDVASWCNVTGHKLVGRSKKGPEITAVIRKNGEQGMNKVSEGIHTTGRGDNKTIIVFSDDLDRALASFVIANGAASMGKKVTMFFTFWGLNVIKKPNKPRMRKGMMDKMFSIMMPGHAGKLPLSSMNMGGIGRTMMKQRMKSKNVDALEVMIDNAKRGEVQMIACQMSMDVMGVREEELIDGIRVGGVANYLEEAESSNLNLFI
jgi:NADPH-dependent 2,4-dienoyl-CoA reductase/sulfur reductase-like enzyme/peroxiredoxin family protein/TusA-related sulfurtransferase/rhodanese-related sulfurtransferase